MHIGEAHQPLDVVREGFDCILRAGDLADFLPSPLPVHVLYSHTCQLSPRLRVFIDWMAEQFRMHAKG